MPGNPGARIVFQDNKAKLLEELNWRKLVEESMWRQKSRIKWFTEGDHNTSYFQKVASIRKHVNTILREMVGLSSSALVEELQSRV